MKKHLKKLKIFVILFAVIGCMIAIPPMMCQADFGNHAGTHSYSRHSTSHSRGSSRSYSSSRSCSSSSTTHSSGSSGTTDDEIANLIVITVFSLIGLGIVLTVVKSIKNSYKLNYENNMYSYINLDPNFDSAALCEKLGNLYVQMQQCWTAKDIEPLRPYFTDALFNQMNMMVQQNIRNGHTNYVERIAVLGVEPTYWYQSNGFDHIKVTIETRIVDYTLDDRTGKLISGSQKAEKFMTYEWDISRKSGVTTTKTAGTHIVVCPNCGANVDINASAICEYCKTPITAEQHDWVITNIKGISQQNR